MQKSIPNSFKKYALWLLDGIFWTLLGSYIAESWDNLLQPILSNDYLRLIIVIVGTISLSILTTLLILRQLRYLKGDTKEGAVPYHSYTNLPFTIEDLFAKAQNEIYFVGITLQSLNHKDETIRNALKRLNVNILLCNENSRFMEQIEQLVVSRNTTERIAGTLGMLQLIRDKVSVEEAKRLVVKRFDFFPIQTIILVDPQGNSGFIQFEPYLYGTSQESRRIFMIERKSNPQLFATIWKSFKSMWNDGKEV